MSWSILSLPLRIYIFLHSIALCLSTQSSSNANILILQRCHSFSHHITSNYWEALSTLGLEKIYSSFMIPLNIQLIQTGKNYAFFSFFFTLSLLFSLQKWHHLPLCPHSTLCGCSDWHLQCCQLHKRQSPCYLSWHLRPREGMWIIS